LTLDPAGSYERVDCNGDGDLDLWSANGRINFDLRQIIGQKRAIDVEIVNGNPTLETTLTGYNPANEIVPDTGVAATSGSVGAAETLNLRSEVQPLHFAELLLGDGCFIGMKLVPPDEPILEATLTPTATVTPSPTTTPTPSATPGCTPSPPSGWMLYTVVPFDTMFNLSNRT
ncbi:MAG: hypothetical protein KC421_23775, partial [Anaerolineales bacterium]|nr:hypothetical protein [Anaerolineales bacterium]